ncbi:hypothetical protein [uncultured Alsobacter sp.]|uniref:hypothetical protein n=1 Tax=uncultured Alsobacter sp. TaxID=1748258 RepID=UPI0025EC1D2C|nr:hypothetical protein [uncultured Alsobacter sp.]
MERATAHETLRTRTATRAASGMRHAAFALAAVAVSAFAGAGCSQAGDSVTSAVKAPIRGAAEITGFATTTPEPKDFVKQTRRPDADFMPVGVTPPARPLKAKTPEEIKAMEADLEGTLQRHNAASGRAPSGDKFKSAASETKSTPAPRGSDRFLIPAKPKPTPAPAGKAKADQSKS